MTPKELKTVVFSGIHANLSVLDTGACGGDGGHGGFVEIHLGMDSSFGRGTKVTLDSFGTPIGVSIRVEGDLERSVLVLALETTARFLRENGGINDPEDFLSRDSDPESDPEPTTIEAEKHLDSKLDSGLSRLKIERRNSVG